MKELIFSFQLLFSLFVGLQGALLFVLHGICKQEARNQWKEWFTKLGNRSLQLYSIAKSTSTATDSHLEMASHKIKDNRQWGSIPTLDTDETDTKTMSDFEKSE